MLNKMLLRVLDNFDIARAINNSSVNTAYRNNFIVHALSTLWQK